MRAALWIVFVVGVAVVLELRTRWISRFSIYTALIAPFMIRYGPLVPLADDVNPQVTGVAIDPTAMNNYYLGLAVMYVALTAGIFLVTSLPGRGEPVEPRRSEANHGLLHVLAILTIAALALVWVVLPWQDFVEGFGAIFSPDRTGALYRLHRTVYGSTTEYSTSALNYLGNFVRFAVAPVVLWILYADGGSRRSRRLAWILLGLLGMIGLLSGQKLPAIVLLLGFWIAVRVRDDRGKWFTKRVAFGAVGFVLVLLPGLYYLQYPTQNYPELVGAGVFRLTAEYSRVAQLRFEFYPNIHPYLSGLNSFIVRGFVTLLGGDTRGVVPPELYLPSVTPGNGPNYLGTWNAGFFADAWADFGWVGIAVEAFAVGFWVALVHRWYQRSTKGPVETGTYVAVCLGVIYLSEVSLLTAGWMHGVVSSFVVLALLRILPARPSHLGSDARSVPEPRAVAWAESLGSGTGDDRPRI
jgi:oligosaccharide repeat unit polymerase